MRRVHASSGKLDQNKRTKLLHLPSVQIYVLTLQSARETKVDSRAYDRKGGLNQVKPSGFF